VVVIVLHLDLQLSMQSVHVTPYVESHQAEVYSIQNYVIKFVYDLRQVGGLLQLLQLTPPIKLTATTI
jgi:hypothetical protein